MHSSHFSCYLQMIVCLQRFSILLWKPYNLCCHCIVAITLGWIICLHWKCLFSRFRNSKQYVFQEIFIFCDSNSCLLFSYYKTMWCRLLANVHWWKVNCCWMTGNIISWWLGKNFWWFNLFTFYLPPSAINQKCAHPYETTLMWVPINHSTVQDATVKYPTVIFLFWTIVS